MARKAGSDLEKGTVSEEHERRGESPPHCVLTPEIGQGWRGLWCEDAGWMAARDALTAVGRELGRLGVKTCFGTSGTFSELLLAEDGKTVRGIKAADGTEWAADMVILATGAWTPVLMDLESQCESKVGHHDELHCLALI